VWLCALPRVSYRGTPPPPHGFVSFNSSILHKWFPHALQSPPPPRVGVIRTALI
jgi:hypothetical protein